MTTWPTAGRLTLPRSTTASTPSPRVTIPIRRTLVPKPEIVMASSHGIANTSNHSEPNAILPSVESFSVPAKRRANPPLTELSDFDGRRKPRPTTRPCPAANPGIASGTITPRCPGNALNCPCSVTSHLLRSSNGSASMASCRFQRFRAYACSRSHAGGKDDGARRKLHNCGNQHREDRAEQALAGNQPVARRHQARVGQNIQVYLRMVKTRRGHSKSQKLRHKQDGAGRHDPREKIRPLRIFGPEEDGKDLASCKFGNNHSAHADGRAAGQKHAEKRAEGSHISGCV